MSGLLLTARRYQGREGVWIFAVVKPEGKFIHIQGQILPAHVMEVPENPALQETPEVFHVLSVDFSANIFFLCVADYFVWVVSTQFLIAARFIGGQQFNVSAHDLPDKAVHSELVSALDHSANYVPFAGDRADNGSLVQATFTVLFVFVAVSILPADVGLVYLYLATKKLYGLAVHGCSPAVAHIPTCPVVGTGVLAENDAVNLQGADAFLCGEHQIAYPEPDLQGNLGVLENGSSQNRKAIPAVPAAILVLANPMKRAGLQAVDLFRGVAARTAHAFGPAHINQELLARLFGRELSVKAIKCFHETNVATFGAGVNSNIITNKICCFKTER